MAWSYQLGNNDGILLRGKSSSWICGVMRRRAPNDHERTIFEVRGDGMGGVRVAPVTVEVDLMADGKATLEFGELTETGGGAPKVPVKVSFPPGVQVRRLCAK